MSTLVIEIICALPVAALFLPLPRWLGVAK
jgi:hypothetical protein